PLAASQTQTGRFALQCSPAGGIMNPPMKLDPQTAIAGVRILEVRKALIRLNGRQFSAMFFKDHLKLSVEGALAFTAALEKAGYIMRQPGEEQYPYVVTEMAIR